ncbi:MAG: NAD(P)-dependent oxidoreductase [Thermoflexales bacterium]|nr:NAD(P)-dependent oxidoreductase [Thermoflexales bacterium]
MTRVILVTGGAGYIGSQLIRDLAADPDFQHDTIRIYDNMQRGHYCALMDLPQKCRYQFVEGDILDRLTLADAMRDVWAVVHLAAVVKTPISFDHPQWTEQVNHWGTATVVDQAAQAGVERLIYTCSASVYGPGGPFREGDPCSPVGPYSISKLQGEQVVMEVGYQRGLQVTSLRLATTVGDAPGVRFEAEANHVAYLAGVGRPVVVQGDGQQRRPLIHVRDASGAIRFCLKTKATEGQVLNAVKQNTSMNELVEAVRQIIPAAPVRYTAQNALTSWSFEVDGGRLESLGFVPQLTIADGLGELIARLSPLGCTPPAGADLLEELE